MCAILLFVMTFSLLWIFMSKSVALKAFIRTFNAQSYVHQIYIGQNYNKQRIWLVNEDYF